MAENRISTLENLIGTTVQINPQKLLNRGRLFTTQSWVDITKLANALNGIPDLILEPPSGWILKEKHELIYIIGDGNHRIGLACIERIQIPFFVVDIWKGENKYGFNKIVNQILSQL